MPPILRLLQEKAGNLLMTMSMSKIDPTAAKKRIETPESLALYVAAWLAEDSAITNAPRDGSDKTRPILLSFAAPDYGIVFRCRVVCSPDDAVATAAMTALRFVEVSLKKANIRSVVLMTDSPAYYFRVTGQTKVEMRPKERREVMEAYRKKFKLEFKLIERTLNPARHNCHAMAKTPSDVEAPLKYNPLKWPQKGKMMPLQNGIEL